MRKLLSVSLAALFTVALGACEQEPASPDGTSSLTDAPVTAATDAGAHMASSSGIENSGAPFGNWYQGFNHGTDGWYGAETPGPLGWCGQISGVSRRDGGVRPSAGRGYATVAQGTCNAFWNTPAEEGGGGFPGLVGAPWAPGPDFAALFRTWPSGGFVMELDIHLDPAYEAVGPEEGTHVFEFADGTLFEWEGVVFGYSVSFATLDDGSFHYLWIPVREGDGRLHVGRDEHEVARAGWYTFRYVFGADRGQLDVDFELARRDGGTLHTESMDALYYAPSQSPSDFSVSNVGTGYAWFTSVSRGLTLPIDEYHVRQGS